MKKQVQNVKVDTQDNVESKVNKALSRNKGKKSKMVILRLNNTMITVFYDSYKIVEEELIFQLNGRDSSIFPVLGDVEISESVMGSLIIKFL